MSKYILTAAALLALTVVGVDAKEASAYCGGGGSYFSGVYSHGGYGHYPQTTYWGGGWGGHSDWHNTSHVDYHPGSITPHYDHAHYNPGHYDVHSSGHWDGHRGGHF